MFMIIKRKHIFIALITLFVVITAIFFSDSTKKNNITKDTQSVDNTYIPTNEADNVAGEAVLVSSENDYLIQAKADRESIRSKALEIINKTIENESTTDKFRAEAEEQILQIASDMDNEKKIETLLFAKGYDNAVVFISNDSVTVTVVKILEEIDVAKINDIVFEQTGNNNIKIVEVG